MSDWKSYLLEQLADIRISNVDKKSKPNENWVLLCNYMDVYSNDYITNDLVFMESTASSVECAKFKVDKGDVLITKDSETPYDIGIPSVVLDDIEDLVCGYHLALIKINNSLVNSLFLSKLLAASDVSSYFSRVAAGSTRYGLSNGAIKKIKVILPSLERQNKIATVLLCLDRTIAKTEALIEKYQQIKAGLMHDLFTRGIGADGKLRSRREEAPELYRESAIGWIPKEWDYIQIKNFVRSAQYGISTSLTDKQTGIPVLRMNNIQSNIFDVSDLKYTTDKEAYKVKLKKGDVLYNRTNSMEHVGKTAIWREELLKCSFASYLVRINLYEEKLLPEFFSHWMSQISSQNELRRYATPAVQQVNINPTNLQKVYISCPCDIREQGQIVARIDKLDFKIQAEKIAFYKLQKQKSGLMHDLLTGKVSVNVDSDAP